MFVIDEKFKKMILNKKYYIPHVLLLIISFAYYIVHYAINVDTIAVSFDYNRAKEIFICQNRASWFVFEKLFNPFGRYNPLSQAVVSVIGLYICSILLNYLFYVLSDGLDDLWMYVISGALLITYPLIVEAWVFPILTIVVYIPTIFVLLSLIYSVKNDSRDKYSFLLLFLGLLGYESVVFVYIFLVVFALLYISIRGVKAKYFKISVEYAVLLLLALGCRYVLNNTIRVILGITKSTGDRTIAWKEGLEYAIGQIAYDGYYYIVRAFEYYPIGVFLAASVVYIVFVIYLVCKKKSAKIAFYGICCYGSIFLLSILIARPMKYRTATAIPFFICGVFFLMYTYIFHAEHKGNSKKFEVGRVIVLSLAFYLSFTQAVYTGSLFFLDIHRSDNEIAVLRQIGYRLTSEYEAKEVVFVGELDLGDYVNGSKIAKDDSAGGKFESYLRKRFNGTSNWKFTENLAESSVTWEANEARQIGEFLSFLGYDIVYTDKYYDERMDIYDYAIKTQMRPLEIRDVGDYIIVFLGEKQAEV